MKSKVVFYLIFFVVFFLPMLNNDILFVRADDTKEISLELVCPEVVLEDEEYQCDVNLKNNGNSVLGIGIDYSFDKGFSYINFKNDKSWGIDAVSSTGVVLTTENVVTTNSYLGTLTFKLTSDAIVGQTYNISVVGKSVYENDMDNYQELGAVTSSIVVSDLTTVLDYVKVGENSLDLLNGTKEYTSVIENNLTSVKIDAKINEKFSNLSFGDEFGTRTINGLNVGDNLNYLTIESNDFEILRLKININRKDSSGNVVEPDDNISENPKTGSISVIVVFTILILSFIIFVRIKKKGMLGDI